MKKQKKLKQVVDILLGYSFRMSLKDIPSGDIAVIQSRDITDNIIVEINNAVKVEKKDFSEKFYLHKNDILLSARGNFKIGIFKEDSAKAIASSSVYVLRLKDDAVYSEYLTIFLNSIEGQRRLNSISSGATIKTILRRELDEIEIVVPSLEKQKKIIEIFENTKKQEKLLNDKIFFTNKIAEGAITKLLN